jgi:hypothetical protein
MWHKRQIILSCSDDFDETESDYVPCRKRIMLGGISTTEMELQARLDYQLLFSAQSEIDS